MAKRAAKEFRKPPFFKFNVADWRSSDWVQAMGGEQRGWYASMLAASWAADKTCYLDNTMEAIERAAGLKVNSDSPRAIAEVGRFRDREPEGVATSSQIVMERFETTPDGKYIFNPRLLKEFEDLLAFRLTKRKAALGRWAQPEEKMPKNGKSRSQRLAKARSKGRHTEAEWQALVVACGDMCVKCKTPRTQLTGDAVCKDHILPIYLGGDDGIGNLQPMCRNCNSGKGSDSTDYRPEGWAERLQNACTMGTDASETETRDRDKRQETKTEKVKTSCSAASAEPIAGTLPLVNGTDYQVTKPELQMWQELFPAVDVDQGFRSMKAWLIANPKNRKTPRGIKKFIQGWLERDHNRARPQSGAGNGKTESAREQIRRVTAGMDEPDSRENQRLVSSVQS